MYNYRLGLRGGVILAAVFFSLLTPADATAQSGYVRQNLVSDVAGQTPQVDPNLINGWGIAHLPSGPWWVSDAGTGFSTVYDGTGAIVPLVVTVPPSSTRPGEPGLPSGIVANSTPDFGGALFIFATLDGTISTWSTGTEASIVIDRGADSAYTGLTMAMASGRNLLYGANFRAGTVDVWDTDFNPVTLAAGAFQDPQLPEGFAPFNVQAVKGLVFVAFAKPSEEGDEEVGPGLGFVDAFTPSGKLILRLQHGPYMNAPWGIALAPSDFGEFSNSLLVGQFGGGLIVAFDPTTGQARGVLHNPSGKPIIVPFIWGMGFGDGTTSGPTNSLYFAAGPADEEHGLFGVITAVAAP